MYIYIIIYIYVWLLQSLSCKGLAGKDDHWLEDKLFDGKHFAVLWSLTSFFFQQGILKERAKWGLEAFFLGRNNYIQIFDAFCAGS